MTYKKDRSRSRTPLAITLIVASFLSAFFLATFSHRGSDFWIASVDMAPGHQIAIGDIELQHFDLDSSSSLYMGKADDPLGLIVMKAMTPGEIINIQSVSSESKLLASSAVPISIRAVDLAAGITVGEAIDIYWVIDSHNGEIPVDPILILGGVRLLSFDQKSKNFGTDAALTVAVEQTQVLRLLVATTHGRLVVVRSHV
jgi:Flp pilus assembly protein CpaB